jgi:hypothetical protein
MEWNQTYGGTNWEEAFALVQTVDGGYALAGRTGSSVVGPYDSWLVKTDADGNMQWNRTYGGTNWEEAWALVQTVDGGYALAGADSGDFWLVKTEANGNAQWNQTYGGTSPDGAYALVQTADGGYALAGFTMSFGAGYMDFWLVKTDASGNALWSITYGGTGYDLAFALVQTSDGGYALAGGIGSFAPTDDFWLVKTDVESGLTWIDSSANTVTLYRGTTDTDWNYVRVRLWKPRTLVFVAAPSGSPPGPGEYDPWLDWNDDGKIDMKDIDRVAKAFAKSGQNVSKASLAYDSCWLDLRNETGEYYVITHNLNDTELQVDAREITPGWNKTYGGTGEDWAFALVQTSDGGYALAGKTASFGAGNNDFRLVKTDASGNMTWNQTYGGTGEDWAFGLVQTADGGYALAGITDSFGAGYEDFWLVKTDVSGNMQWNKTYGGTSGDEASALVQTSDGGYALAGCTGSSGAGGYDCWLVRTDGSGTMQWNKTYGGTGEDDAYALVQTVDGGYALACWTVSSSSGSYDFWLVKTEAESGLAWVDSSANAITLYRGATDPYWNFVRVRLWKPR